MAHFPESRGMSYNAQLVTPAPRAGEKDRGYIKGPHYIQDDSGAWTCPRGYINSEVQKGFRFFFPFKLDSKITKD